jgi:CHAD domain-containing protein
MSITRQCARFVFHGVERDLSKLSSRLLPESVHSFRTTTRRLQTLLEALLPERNRNQKKLLKLLDAIRKRAGKVRNLDVQLSALRSLKILQEPRRKTLLLQELLEVRAKHERKLSKVLTRRNLREIRKRLKRASKELRLESARDPLTVAREMLTEAAGRAAAGDEPALHECRILIKRARYAAEFASKNPEAAQVVVHLKRLQDAIGAWHDWQILTNSAAARLGDIRQSSLVAELHNVTGGKLRNALAALASCPVQLAKPVFTSGRSRKPDLNAQAREQSDSAA